MEGYEGVLLVVGYLETSAISLSADLPCCLASLVVPLLPLRTRV